MVDDALSDLRDGDLREPDGDLQDQGEVGIPDASLAPPPALPAPDPHTYLTYRIPPGSGSVNAGKQRVVCLPCLYLYAESLPTGINQLGLEEEFEALPKSAALRERKKLWGAGRGGRLLADPPPEDWVEQGRRAESCMLQRYRSWEELQEEREQRESEKRKGKSKHEKPRGHQTSKDVEEVCPQAVESAGPPVIVEETGRAGGPGVAEGRDGDLPQAEKCGKPEERPQQSAGNSWWDEWTSGPAGVPSAEPSSGDPGGRGASSAASTTGEPAAAGLPAARCGGQTAPAITEAVGEELGAMTGKGSEVAKPKPIKQPRKPAKPKASKASKFAADQKAMW